MTSLSYTDELDKTVTQLMTDFEADTARIDEFEGGPVVILGSPVDGEHWFLVANEKPAHASGEWFECEGLMVTRVEDPAELCTCEQPITSDGTYFPFEPHGDCPVHA